MLTFVPYLFLEYSFSLWKYVMTYPVERYNDMSVKIHLSENGQQEVDAQNVLKFWDESLRRYRTCIILKISLRVFIYYKGIKKQPDHAETWQSLNYPSDWGRWRSDVVNWGHVTLLVFLPKGHRPLQLECVTQSQSSGRSVNNGSASS